MKFMCPSIIVYSMTTSVMFIVLVNDAIKVQKSIKTSLIKNSHNRLYTHYNILPNRTFSYKT